MVPQSLVVFRKSRRIILGSQFFENNVISSTLLSSRPPLPCPASPFYVFLLFAITIKSFFFSPSPVRHIELENYFTLLPCPKSLRVHRQGSCRSDLFRKRYTLRDKSQRPVTAICRLMCPDFKRAVTWEISLFLGKIH